MFVGSPVGRAEGGAVRGERGRRRGTRSRAHTHTRTHTGAAHRSSSSARFIRVLDDLTVENNHFDDGRSGYVRALAHCVLYRARQSRKRLSFSLWVFGWAELTTTPNIYTTHVAIRARTRRLHFARIRSTEVGPLFASRALIQSNS